MGIHNDDDSFSLEDDAPIVNLLLKKKPSKKKRKTNPAPEPAAKEENQMGVLALVVGWVTSMLVVTVSIPGEGII